MLTEEEMVIGKLYQFEHPDGGLWYGKYEMFHQNSYKMVAADHQAHFVKLDKIHRVVTLEIIMEEYLKYPNQCPMCGGDNLDTGLLEIDSPLSSQSVKCNDCPATWMDLHELVGACNIKHQWAPDGAGDQYFMKSEEEQEAE